ncbi:deoxyhypusine synthase [Candidatus Pacearchaeota archaeon CG10_big_fil_rev_8_21_14_0_10_32_14]|nr:MAG: deoxyhypusine synthase [Candidatus Pacearchaeota archaeon CG10_big_fil_rev_8_21_14_0_10_32_14]
MVKSDISSKLEKVKREVFKKASQVKGTAIKGPDFNKNLTTSDLINSYDSIGFQASHLHQAIELIKKMRKEKCTIFLGYTSGIVSSGLRDVVRYLVENKFIDVLVTTSGGVEEDLIKTMKPFVLGEFNADGSALRNAGVNRIGNIFVPNDRYCLFEDWINPHLKSLLEKQKSGENLTPSRIINFLGEKINHKDSIYYHAHKNNIPVFTPAPLDGSLGDMIYFFKQSNPEFKIDLVEDHKKLIDIAINSEKTGLIILGAGVVKHAVCNANLFRGGADYAVYINAAQEFDGSDAGASPNEAVSWGKIKPPKSSSEKNTVKVFADATLVFPMIVSEAFKK